MDKIIQTIDYLKDNLDNMDIVNNPTKYSPLKSIDNFNLTGGSNACREKTKQNLKDVLDKLKIIWQKIFSLSIAPIIPFIYILSFSLASLKYLIIRIAPL